MKRLNDRTIEVMPCILLLLLIAAILIRPYIPQRSHEKFWVGEYGFLETYYLRGNQSVAVYYHINIYEEDGLYAKIEVGNDGKPEYQSLLARVWTDYYGEEIILEFMDYDANEQGIWSGTKEYSKGDILLKLRKEENEILTEWEAMPVSNTEIERYGRYFQKLE